MDILLKLLGLAETLLCPIDATLLDAALYALELPHPTIIDPILAVFSNPE